jgi:hypothetical protein
MHRRAPAVLVTLALALGALSASPGEAAPRTPSAPTSTSGTTSEQPLTQTTVMRGKKGKLVWDVTSFVAGTGAQVAAHGKVKAKGKRKVYLQVKAGRGWRKISKTKTDKKGNFAIGGALDWYGVHKVRVTIPGRRGFSKSTKVSVGTQYTPRGQAADWVQMTTGGSTQLPIRQNPCGTVRYLVNSDDVGPAGVAMVQLAMTYVSWATGIKVQYVGNSSLIPLHSGKRLPGKATMLIGWADANEVPEMPAAHAVGLTSYDRNGRYAGTVRRDAKGKRVLQMKYTDIALSTEWWFNGVYNDDFGPSPKTTYSEVVMHEIGHAFGLDHAPTGDEIMYYQSGNGVYPDGLFRGQYALGDLTGLAKNGLDTGCNRSLRGGYPGKQADLLDATGVTPIP